jgi:phospholipid/cholesterol/gamma-HCH transport system substrate-binding protein
VNGLLTPDNKKSISSAIASASRMASDLELAAQRLPGTLARADSRMQAWLGEDNRRLARDTLAHVNEASQELPPLVRDARRLAEDSRRLVERVERLAGDAQGAAGSVRHETLPRVNALADSVERGAGRVGKLAQELERRPESLIWGRPAARPGPGEAGFE